jgi:acyl carrier protein
MTDEDKVVAAIKKLATIAGPISAASHLRNDLGLDSANLIELTVLIHSLYGVDLGRRAAEQNSLPATVGDLVQLMREP